MAELPTTRTDPTPPTTGEVGPGMFAIVRGEVTVTQQGPLGRLSSSSHTVRAR